MTLIVFLSSRISPRTSTVILRDKSPRATAVVTSAMLRTCAVRLDAMDVCLAAELAFGADFARHARDFGREGVELIDHRIDRVFEFEDFALHIDRDLARQVAARDGGRYLGDIAHLAGEVGRHGVDA